MSVFNRDNILHHTISIPRLLFLAMIVGLLVGVLPKSVLWAEATKPLHEPSWVPVGENASQKETWWLDETSVEKGPRAGKPHRALYLNVKSAHPDKIYENTFPNPFSIYAVHVDCRRQHLEIDHIAVYDDLGRPNVDIFDSGQLKQIRFEPAIQSRLIQRVCHPSRSVTKSSNQD